MCDKKTVVYRAVTATQPAGQTVPPKGMLTGNWLDIYYLLQSSKIHNTKPFLRPGPHSTDNLSRGLQK